MWDSDFQVKHVTCPCNQFLNKLPDHCFVQGHVAAGLEEFRSLLPNSGSTALASAATTFFLAKIIGRLGREPFSMNGSSDIDFLSHCMVSLKTFVMSNGLLILRLLKSLADSLGLKSKESNPSCARNSFSITKIIIPIMWSAIALNFT